MSIGAQRIAIPDPGALRGLNPPGAGTSLPYVAQSETYWCWAACGEMLLHLPGHVLKSQCDIADASYGPGCCARPHAPPLCNHGKWPHDAYPPLGLQPTAKRPLTEVELKAELARDRPVQICFQWSGSTDTHVAVVTAARSDGQYQVNDPDPNRGSGPVAFDQIVHAYGEGDWILAYTY